MKNIIVPILKKEKVYFAQAIFRLKIPLMRRYSRSKTFPLYYEVVTMKFIRYDREIVFQFS